MRWADVDDKVTNRCVVSISGDSSLLEYSGRHGIYAPIIARKVGNHMILTMLMKKARDVDRFTTLFPRVFNGEEKGDSWLIKFPLKSFPELSIIDEINKIPSVIMQNLYLQNGKFMFDIRFHRSRSSEVSSIIMDHLADDDGKIALESFTLRSGAISFLTGMNSKVPLTLITYSIPAFNEDPIERCLSSDDSIAEIEKKPGSNYRALIFSKSPITERDDLITISEEDNLYETWGDNPILREIRTIGNDNSILRLAHFLRVSEGRLIVSVFIPAVQAMDFIRIIAGVSLGSDKHPVRLHSFQACREDLFNSIGMRGASEQTGDILK